MDEAAHPVPHRLQIKPARRGKLAETTIDEYRRIRDELRQTTDRDRELQLREALDSVWFRLKRNEQRRLNREYSAYLKSQQ